MELLDAVERLRVETEQDAHDDDQQFHPLARAHLGTAAAHLQQARAAIDRATGYGVACELIRDYDLDDDSGSPCDAERLYEVLVWLPGEGFEELACPVHAAVAERRGRRPMPALSSGRRDGVRHRGGGPGDACQSSSPGWMTTLVQPRSRRSKCS
ncbi:hypothetical protein [Microtetraspora sp. NBRC 13810]|uniref:hypothetical protein n=1 Tax=Microtetraspora sp. NBRC 13810 TaxID=3030990 RepID=UPI002555276C|nr:hypothetical protein [Microtetraspora sp. NBRC 13810]